MLTKADLISPEGEVSPACANCINQILHIFFCLEISFFIHRAVSRNQGTTLRGSEITSKIDFLFAVRYTPAIGVFLKQSFTGNEFKNFSEAG